MKGDLKSCVPAVVIILLLYALAGTSDYATQCEKEHARLGAKP
jgi:hypothetical protein